jgi:thymidylate synthase ThyX
MDAAYHVESLTDGERALLSRWVTDVDGPVFVLTGLPQVTCAALFARYSRSPKSLRRLLLDEFGEGLADGAASAVGAGRARELFGRVLAEYGDDSVAQLAGVHLACEQASQLLCKAIEWGRLAGYLEQSTRYIPYTDRRDGRHRYHLDPEVEASDLAPVYRAAMDGLFEAYCAILPALREHLDRTLPEEADAAARRRAVRALALDVARALLPAGTVSNVGVFASPQALEQLVLRLRAHPLPEARAYAERIATQLRQVIPDFLPRLDRPDRGGVWVEYLAETAEALRRHAATVAPGRPGRAVDGARLVRWDPDGELRVAAAALYPHSGIPDEELLRAVHALGPEALGELVATAAGERRNRRHRPGRGFEHTEYTFDVVSDYGAFRDLQRHRMLTIQWQELTCELGSDVPEAAREAGVGGAWEAAVQRAEEAWERLRPRFPQQSGYLATLGHRVRYQLRLNAREAMHLIELRTSPQAHPSYRRLCLEMLSGIREVAGHRHLAAAMRFAGGDDVHLPRYAAEAARAAAADR